MYEVQAKYGGVYEHHDVEVNVWEVDVGMVGKKKSRRARHVVLEGVSSWESFEQRFGWSWVGKEMIVIEAVVGIRKVFESCGVNDSLER